MQSDAKQREMKPIETGYHLATILRFLEGISSQDLDKAAGDGEIGWLELVNALRPH